MGIFRFGNWEPGIGDPNFMGWFTVFAYLVAAILSGVVAYRSEKIFPIDRASKKRILWWCLSGILFFLAINKQLDLQTLFTEIGRVTARSQGWYQERRVVQKWFVLGMVTSGLLVLMVAGWVMHNYLHDDWLMFFGFVFLITFIVIRAASFHHFEVFLGHRFLELRMNWILELGGIFCIAFQAIINLKRKKMVPLCD